MSGFFRKLFNMYPGEGKNASSFALLGFMWAFAVSLGWKNADALFLLNVGAESLPIAYACIASIMIGIASFMMYAYNQFPVHRIFMTALIVAACFYSFAYTCIHYNLGIENKWLWYLLRIFGWVFFTVLNTSFWTFIDQFYHIRDSNRLFCLFSSSIFIGIALTGAVMRSGLFEFSEICLAIIALFMATLFWISRIVKRVQPVHGEHEIDSAPQPSDQTIRQALKTVLTSKFALCLMCFNFLTFVSVILTEYNYMFAFQDHFGGGFEQPISNEEDAPLMLFLGQCIIFVSLFNVVFGMFFYSRFIRRFGIGGMIIITPLLLIFAYSGWPMSSTMFFPLVLFFVSEGTFFIIDDSNFNLLLNGVPTKLKYKIRIFIESFFEPVGTLTSAFLLSFSMLDSRLLGFLVALLLVAVGTALRKLYPKAILTNLAENTIHFEKTPKEWLPALSKKERKASESRLLAILKMGDFSAQEFAIEGLLDFEDPSILDRMLAVLEQCPAATKKLFIAKLGRSIFSNEARIIERLLAWEQEESNTELLGPLYFYLAKQGLLSPQKALLALRSSDLNMRGAALIALKKSPAFSSSQVAAELQALAAEHLQELLGSENEEAISVGINVLAADANPEDVNSLIPYLNSESSMIARQAAHLIAEIATPQSSRHARILLRYIESQSDNAFRLELLKAIGKMLDTSLVSDLILLSLHLRPNERRMIEKIIIQLGLRTVPELISLTKDSGLHDKCRVLAGKILGRLALPQLRANLYPLIGAEIDRALFYFYYHHTIQKRYPQYDLHVLQDALLSGYHSVIDFIIQLLSLSGEIEDPELLSRSMRSHNPKIRSQVIETLEKTCEPQLFRLLQPLVDDWPVAEKLRYYSQEPIDLQALLDVLRHSASLTDQIASAAISSSIKTPNWQHTLKQQMKGNEEIFNHFAYEILESKP